MRGNPIIAALLLPLLAAGCVSQQVEQRQVRSALVNAGLSPPIAQCMAHRLVDQLTIKQLRKLQALQGPRRTVADYIAVVQRIDDPQVMRVTISSAALCVSGWER
jgi:hypothetical protein